MELLYNEKIVKATLDDMLTVVDEVNKEIIVDKNDDIKKLKPADLVFVFQASMAEIVLNCWCVFWFLIF